MGQKGMVSWGSWVKGSGGGGGPACAGRSSSPRAGEPGESEGQNFPSSSGKEACQQRRLSGGQTSSLVLGPSMSVGPHALPGYREVERGLWGLGAPRPPGTCPPGPPPAPADAAAGGSGQGRPSLPPSLPPLLPPEPLSTGVSRAPTPSPGPSAGSPEPLPPREVLLARRVRGARGKRWAEQPGVRALRGANSRARPRPASCSVPSCEGAGCAPCRLPPLFCQADSRNPVPRPAPRLAASA